MENTNYESFRYYLSIHKDTPRERLLKDIKKLNNQKVIERSLESELYHSLRMSSNFIVLDDIRSIIAKKPLDNLYEDRVIIESQRLLDCLLTYNSISYLSLDVISKVNNLITGSSEIREESLKDRDGKDFVNPEQITLDLSRLCSEYNNSSKTLKDVFSFVYEFLLINPFKSGNGRTSRVIMNGLLESAKYPRLIIDSTRVKYYYKAIKKSRVDCNKNCFIDYCLVNLKYTLHRL